MNQVNETEARIQELDEWWGVTLEISTQIEPLAVRKKFLGLVNNCRGVKRQNTALVNEKRGLEEALMRHAEESARESQALKQEIRKLKEELDAVRRQDTGSQQMARSEHTHATQHGYEAAQTPRKRQRTQSPGGSGGTGTSNDRPVARPRSVSGGVSRDKIRTILGGSDRGWGSTMSGTGVGCEYHTLLDTVAHLFEQAVSSKQDIAQAVFGFGPDDELVSGDYVFPLFVRNTVGENPTGFTYLGNYSASRLDPVPWEELSNTAKEYAVKIVQSKGLSTSLRVQKREKEMGADAIFRKFCESEYVVPRSRLEFQHYDNDMIEKIQSVDGRRRRPHGPES